MTKSDYTEATVKADARRYLDKLKTQGYRLSRIHYSAYGGVPGVGDFLVCFEGSWLEIECKAPHRKTHKYGGLSKNQIARMNTVTQAGGFYVIIYDWRDLEQFLFDEKLILKR